MRKKAEQGITLMALVITVAVLLIIASIGINAGTDIIKKAQLESIKTNMLLIQAKAKEYVEEVSFKKGPGDTTNNIEQIRSEIYEKKYGLAKPGDSPGEVSQLVGSLQNSDNIVYYYVQQKALETAGLNNVTEGKGTGYYVVGFDETNLKVEVYNTVGFDNKHSLTEIEQIEE